MSPDATFLDSLSEWHTIRPGKPPLSLSVREITSVSVTFILSSTFSDFGAEAEPFLASLGLAAEDNDNDEDDRGDDETDDSGSAEPKKPSVISEVLAKGLSVNVNSATWKNVYIHIEEKTDEAVIIIYNLMPGKKYDIDLGLVQGGQSNNIRRQVVTDDLELPTTALPEANNTHFESADSSLPTPSTSPSRTSGLTSTPPLPSTSSLTASHPHPHPHPQLTPEDRLTQLTHALALLAAEREALSTSLKSARRDAQRADAALRSEIDAIRRGSEKHAAAEARARQKVLALQEAVKRAQTATREVEEQVREVEGALPGLRSERAAREEAYERIRGEADRVRGERAQGEERERRRLEGLRGELTGLGNKVERLGGKREKLEGGVIPDLEAQLREIELEIERAEADPWAARYDEDGEDEHDLFGGAWATAQRHGQQVPGILTRPSPIPIQRPGQTSSSASGLGFPQWTAPAPSRHHQHASASNTGAGASQHPSAHQRSSSSRAPPPTRSPTASFALPQRHSSLKNSKSKASSSDPSASASLNSSPTPAPAVAASTLSSRAAPFEPGRISFLASSASGNGWPAPMSTGRGNGAHGQSHKWGS